MDTTHQQAVKQLQAQVSDFYARKVPFRVYHGSTNSTRVMEFHRDRAVDTSRLNRVLAIDTEKMTVLAEPNVPMDKLVKATLKRGLVPPVVPEFPGITVGGALQGTAAETSSHHYGCFSQTVRSVEMVLGDGSLVTASAEENSDLFYGVAGSSGSLGLTTALEIQLVPAKKYVQVTPQPIGSFEEGVRLMREYAASDVDFIEWVMFSRDRGAIVLGRLSDTPVGDVKRFSRPFDTWYYLYFKQITNRKLVTDSVPLKDYLFRFNRGAFWTAELAFKQAGLPFNALTRLLLDPWLRTRKLYQALQASAAAQEYLCQDLMLPAETAVQFLEFIDSEFAIYPVGGCPVLPEPRSKLQCNGLETELAINIGVYGLRITPYDDFVAANRKIERTTAALGGKKWLYAYNHYTKQEFWSIYDQTWYRHLRTKYHATTLPDLFERTRITKRYAVSKRKGMVKTMLGLGRLRIQ